MYFFFFLCFLGGGGQNPGAGQDYQNRGGAKDYVHVALIPSVKHKVPYGRGPGPCLRALEALGFEMLSHAI